MLAFESTRLLLDRTVGIQCRSLAQHVAILTPCFLFHICLWQG